MTRIETLLDNYRKHVSLPWRKASSDQRVMFCVYSPEDEMKIRFHLDEFKATTEEAGHSWKLFDMTDSFASWMSNQKYAKKYFASPDKFSIQNGFAASIVADFQKELGDNDENTVVALLGVGSLFGFVLVKSIVERLAEMVPGRIMVFFPGDFSNNNYRLLDAYDGWGYLATPITADKQF